MYRFAYVEFADKDSTKTALALDESLFKGRQLKVCVHHYNRHNITQQNNL